MSRSPLPLFIVGDERPGRVVGVNQDDPCVVAGLVDAPGLGLYVGGRAL